MGDWKSLGGVRYNTDDVQSASRLKNGKYQLNFNNGTSLIFDEQKSKQAYAGYSTDRYRNRKSAEDTMSLRYIDGAEYKNSKDSKCKSLIVHDGKNMTIDVSKNNEKDNVWVQWGGKNITVKNDKYDRAYGEVNGEKHSANFNCEGEGTYKLKVPTILVERKNVPAALLKQYDAISKKNKNGDVDTEEELLEFEKIVQDAFDNKQITKKDAEKMGFVSFSVYKHVKYCDKLGGAFAEPIISNIDKVQIDSDNTGIQILNFCTGITGLFLGFVSGMAGAGIGLVVDAGRESYDLVTGEMGRQIKFTHWKTNLSDHWSMNAPFIADWCPSPKKD